MTQKACTLRQKVTKNIQCNYLLFLPQSYDQTKKRWPLILFLHGMDESGDDLSLVKKHGLAKIVEEKLDFPFVVVSPQCPRDEWWSTDALVSLLDTVEKNYRIDKKRVYVTGLSMGGYTTWQLAIEHPHRFAAIAPICGGGNPYLAYKIKQLPIWVFHGAKDKAVPIAESREMISALRKQGGNIRFTIYRNGGHDSWSKTYQNEKLYDWFLSHSRS
ncbi:MAG: prolyl oligopeptidase family serine peptidase [Methylacidiphilales bacterium]|nr:prolyl oligopeptidase family serine peptidase [Candidatus Methylacidiphilales bacterium]